MENKSYSEKDYLEDLRLSKWYLGHFLKNKVNDYDYVLSDLVSTLWRARKFYNKNLVRFSTYATKVLSNKVKGIIRAKNYKGRSLILMSLDEEIAEDLTLADIIAEQQTEDMGVIEMIKKILKTYNIRNKSIISKFIYGISMTEIASMFGLSHQSISKIIKKFRSELALELAKVNYKVGV